MKDCSETYYDRKCESKPIKKVLLLNKHKLRSAESPGNMIPFVLSKLFHGHFKKYFSFRQWLVVKINGKIIKYHEMMHILFYSILTILIALTL